MVNRFISEARLVMNNYKRNQHFKFGKKNPTLMDKPFWKYMVCNPHITASRASKRYEHRAVWCFARLGATQTYLPDGRLIQIGGEHEDSYDPNFQIYNDVVVIRNPHMTQVSDGYSLPVPSNFPLEQNDDFKNSEILGTSNQNDVTIYGYPENIFPPTDFHTATYVKHVEDSSECIYIIGGLGYLNSTHRKETNVYRLHLSDFTIHLINTSGDRPEGCTKRHRAIFVKDNDRQLIEISLEDNRRYRLDIETAVWRTVNDA